MAVVIASDLSKDVAGRPLLRGVSFKLERRDRMTLSGRNGSGKTTLLRMLAGDASVDSGSLTLQKGAKIALYDQRPPRERDLSLRDYVLSGATEVAALEAELARLEQAMAEGAHDEPTLAAYGRTQERFDLRGGYRWRDRALTTARGLGFEEGQLDRRLSTFSGGELTRASLARALTGDPDLLLLDEPTNHLDIASLEWLEAHLRSLDAAIVLVAHDRWFLEAVGTSVLELEAGRSRFFKGPCTRGARSTPRARSRSVARSSGNRPRSRGSSASWSASGQRRPRHGRRSHASSVSTRSNGSSATRATRASSRSPSRSRSEADASFSSCAAGGSKSPGVCSSRTPRCTSSVAST